jgi:hypothetical protein
MFKPKGRVLLAVAVDRLAESRRAAAQTNDDARNSVRVELRGEFYSGLMLTTVIHPETGQTHTIRPERWGLQEALTWLKKGKCQLADGLVYPRLGISFNNDPTVSIFMSARDLQRLLAKQEDKQEAAPPPSPLSRRKPKPASEAEATKKFDDWRESRGDNIPSMKEDFAHMRQHGVSRDRVRKLRQRPRVKNLLSGSGKRPTTGG